MDSVSLGQSVNHSYGTHFNFSLQFVQKKLITVWKKLMKNECKWSKMVQLSVVSVQRQCSLSRPCLRVACSKLCCAPEILETLTMTTKESKSKMTVTLCTLSSSYRAHVRVEHVSRSCSTDVWNKTRAQRRKIEKKTLNWLQLQIIMAHVKAWAIACA